MTPDRQPGPATPAPPTEVAAALNSRAVAADHAILRREAHERGVADALRHQEDLLGRSLPFAHEARAGAERRLELLGEARAAAVASAEARRAAAESRIVLARSQLQAADAALASHIPSPQQMSLPPLVNPPTPLARLALFGSVALGLASVAGSVLLETWVPLATGLPVFAALLWAADAWRPVEPEPQRVTALRRAHADAAGQLQRAMSESTVAHLDILATAERADRLARAEQAMARERLAIYCAAALGALAPGALADDAEFGEQADPTPVTPDWVVETIPEGACS